MGPLGSRDVEVTRGTRSPPSAALFYLRRRRRHGDGASLSCQALAPRAPLGQCWFFRRKKHCGNAQDSQMGSTPPAQQPHWRQQSSSHAKPPAQQHHPPESQQARSSFPLARYVSLSSLEGARESAPPSQAMRKLYCARRSHAARTLLLNFASGEHSRVMNAHHRGQHRLHLHVVF